MRGGIRRVSRISNCWIWALARWFAGYRQGRYLIIRKSRKAWFPHFGVSETAPRDYESFVPVNPVPRWWPFFVFRGYVKRGDKSAGFGDQ